MMQMIIEARFIDDLGETARVPLVTIERELTTSALGMSLAEDKGILASVQKYMVSTQCESIADAHSFCEKCEARLGVKGFHERRIRTVFGSIDVISPRVRRCRCDCLSAGSSFSPPNIVVPTGMTPELEYLQVKWAAHLPYAAATKLLSEVLPVVDAVSVSGLKRRVRVVGAALESSSDQPSECKPGLIDGS